MGLSVGPVQSRRLVSTKPREGSVCAADAHSRSGSCPAPVWVSEDLGVAASRRLAGESEARPTTIQTRACNCACGCGDASTSRCTEDRLRCRWDRRSAEVTFPRLLHHGQRSELLCGLGPVLMVFDALHGRHIPNGTVRPLLIIFSAPGFNHDLGLQSREQPVLVQTLISKLAVEAFNTRVLDRLPRLDAVQRHPMLTGPCIQRRP